MGCDGGTIPKRDELVRVKKNPEQKDKDAELAFKWRHCALSQQVLQPPIVACGLGRLYTKSNILEALLDKSNMPENIKHIRNMKDIKDLELTKNPAFDESAEKTEGALDDRGFPYICPIVGLEMSGKFRFVFLWSCGCVVSERALKEIKMNVCHMCQKPFTSNDIIIINGSDADVELMREKLKARQLAMKAEKKNKSSKNEIPTSTETSQAGPSTETRQASTSTTTQAEPSICNNSENASTSKSTEANKETSNLSSKNLQIPLELPKAKRDAIGVNSVMKANKRHAPNNASLQDPVYKKTKDDYSVAKDPKATEVFKSLFTTHQSDKDQKRAHWITYNPFYN